MYYQTSKWTTDEQQWIKQLFNQVQMGHSLGGNLTKELDNKNIENETITQKLAEVTTDLEKVKEDNRDLTQENLRLTQDNTQKDNKIEYLTKKNEEYQGEIQKKNQERENRERQTITGLQKLNTIYLDLKTQKDIYKTKYYESGEKIKSLEEKLRQTHEQQQESQTTSITAPPDTEDKDDSSKGIPWDLIIVRILTTFGTEAIKVFNQLNNPTIPLTTTKTPQPDYPLKMY